MFDGFVDTAAHLLKLVSQYPDIEAAIVGISLSIGATQFFKQFIPDSVSDETYGKLCQLIGFVTGWVFAHGAWILFDHSSSHFEKLYWSAGCGFASPAVYSFLSGFLEHRFSWWDKYFGGRSKPTTCSAPSSSTASSPPSSPSQG